MSWNMDKETQRGIADRANSNTNFKRETLWNTLEQALIDAAQRSLMSTRIVNVEQDELKPAYIVQTHGVSMKGRKMVTRFKQGKEL